MSVVLGGVEVNAVQVGQRPLCSEQWVSQMRTLRHSRSAVFAMNPSLICGALATGESGQGDAGSLFGRHLRSAKFKIE